MPNYKLIIQYDGGRYRGWQKLGNTDNTIQGKLERVLAKLVGGDTEIIGCSRTDAGVHALSHVANFHTEKHFTEDELKEYFNRYLPDDISVISVDIASDRFHARYNTKSKTYLYRIWNKEYSNPFMRKYSMHVDEKLDTANMLKAGGYFVGEHDFTAYSNAKSKKKSMVRRINWVDIKEEEGFINIRICGDGFLYNMVRKIVGTLIEVGLGEIKANDIPDIIDSGIRKDTGRMAEPWGLYLEKVEY
ncbi:MAG: tRNA pseudouridine(38-40) synthase TruA [Anaerolineaceae bacterium]|nr:MAG: tRNA pseudouridine(38-40) synthase TruA [Anaerolineaceae bacterium]